VLIKNYRQNWKVLYTPYTQWISLISITFRVEAFFETDTHTVITLSKVKPLEVYLVHYSSCPISNALQTNILGWKIPKFGVPMPFIMVKVLIDVVPFQGQ